MKLGITEYSFHRTARDGKMDIETFLRTAADLGFEGVDLLSYDIFWKNREAEMAKVSDWLKETGLILAAYATSDNMITEDKAERIRQIARVTQAIVEASRLKAPILRVFGGSVSSEIPKERSLELVIEGFGEVVPVAEREGIVLAIENHGGVPGTSAEVLQVIKALDSDYFKACVDVGNFLGVGQEPTEAVPALMPYAAHIHLKDMKKLPAQRGDARSQRLGYALQGTAVGEGDIDYSVIFPVIEQSGYAGFAALEYEGTEDEMEGVKKSIANIRKLWER